MSKYRDEYARYGGVHFTHKASASEINTFVAQLPDDKKDSLFEVLNELNEAGLIQILNDGKFVDNDGEVQSQNNHC